MYSLMMQNWTTLKGAANSSLVQSESGWIECSDIQDLTFWLDVRLISATGVFLYYETAPAMDNSLFQPMVAGIDLSALAPATVVQTNALAGISLLPPASYVRWRIGAGVNAFAVTFRLYATGNRVGGVLPPRQPPAPNQIIPLASAGASSRRGSIRNSES